MSTEMNPPHKAKNTQTEEESEEAEDDCGDPAYSLARHLILRHELGDVPGNGACGNLCSIRARDTYAATTISLVISLIAYLCEK